MFIRVSCVLRGCSAKKDGPCFAALLFVMTTVTGNSIFSSLVLRLPLFFLVIFLAACGKNDSIRTSGGYYPSYPSYPGGGGTQLPNYTPLPDNSGLPYSPPMGNGPYAGGWPYSGGAGGMVPGGTFQPYAPTGYGSGFYPWMPIYGYYQQSAGLQPVFISLWNGWQDYACANQLSVYDFTQFWYSYCPQVMSSQLYRYFSNQFYPWMTPHTVFSSSMSPQVFWQNYLGRSF